MSTSASNLKKDQDSDTVAVKCVVVGDGAVGKSSLVSFFFFFFLLFYYFYIILVDHIYI